MHRCMQLRESYVLTLLAGLAGLECVTEATLTSEKTRADDVCA